MSFKLSSRRSRQLALTLAAIALVSACAIAPLNVDQLAKAPLVEGFGATTLRPSQIKPEAQALFAQGMAQVYGFNELEAIRAFKAALAQDPQCAMCAWGVAYQLGPNINATKRGNLREAIQYVEYALKHSASSSKRDQALIKSLALRYGSTSAAGANAQPPEAICRTGSGRDPADPLDLAYADRMHQLVEAYPDDPDVLAMYAEAEMIATRDDWWHRDTGKPAGRMGEVASRIEAALAHHIDHVGLNHYMIHAVDAVQVAGRAVPAADRLGRLAPKSPHLLHMPSHIFAQVGRYADATRVNQLAVTADETMQAALKKQGFGVNKDWRFHNTHFQWYGALMEGRGELALSSARAAALRVQGDHDYGEYMRSLPVLTLLHLQRWDALLAEPMPSGGKGVAASLGEMARGIAMVHKGQLAQAKAALLRLEKADAEVAKRRSGGDGFSKIVRSLAASSKFQLQAALALAERRHDEALALQAKAADAATDADHSEPPMLAGGARLRLAAMQLQEGQAVAAEASYRAELAEHVGSGWALNGLGKALKAQGKQAEMPAVQAQLNSNWVVADEALRVLP
jgi:hypothetical protein